MQWTTSNPPSAIRNKSKGAIKAGVDAANSCLSKGQDEQSCIFAAIAAANAWDKKNNPSKQKKRKLPSHVPSMRSYTEPFGMVSKSSEELVE